MTTCQTLASKEKQKPPVAYSSIVRRMTSRVNQLHDELALESVSNIEFEQSSRRSFDFLQGQVRTLKEAFNTLTDTILEELDFLSSTTRGELWRLDERQSGLEKAFLRDAHEQQLRQQQVQQQVQQQLTMQLQQELAKHQQDFTTRLHQTSQELQQDLQQRQTDLEKRVELMAQDLDTVLGVVPKVEDTMLKTTSHLQERISGNAVDVSKLNDAMAVDRMKVSGTTERLEARIRSLESDLREEVEQRHLKLQRSITRQLESMSRALIESDRPVGQGMPSLSQQEVAAGLSAGLSGGHPGPFGPRQVDFDMSGTDRLDPLQHGINGGFTSRLQ